MSTEKDPHVIWHKFEKFLTEKYGEDLYGPMQYFPGSTEGYRNFDLDKLYKRLVGPNVINEIEKYAEQNPEIEVIPCDDNHFASSIIVLVPHPEMGITMLFVPQLTQIQNQLFLYGMHHQLLMKALGKLSYVYNKK